MSLPSCKLGCTSYAFHSSHLRGHSLPKKLPAVEMDISGNRPACFSSTLQECAFVLTATLATAQTSLFGGIVVCITSHIADDLHMSIAEVTWLSAAQASVLISQKQLLFSQLSFQQWAIFPHVSLYRRK